MGEISEKSIYSVEVQGIILHQQWEENAIEKTWIPMEWWKQFALDITWKERFLDLIEFKKQWGQFDVPQRYAKNPKLGLWVIHHRSQYRLLKSGEKFLISDGKNLDLNGILTVSCHLTWPGMSGYNT